MPLCTMAMSPEMCGCALRSVGAPWVAQRVCAILEPAQPVDEEGDDVAARRRTDDAAHRLALLRRLPSGDGNLPRARHRELPGRRVLVDGGAGADIRALRHAYRRNQRRVGADEAVVLDDRTVLRRPVVVAGDGAGADVDARAELGVADVRKMVRLGRATQSAGFDFDEIADVHF